MLKRSVTFFLDVKSPHSYLILGPVLQLQRDYKVDIHLKPYTLSFLEMGISTVHESSGVRKPPSLLAERRARMFYSAAREYGTLQGLEIRGPYKLLQSRIANLALLRAEECGLGINFLQKISAQGWPSGWRDFDMENPETLKGTLEEIGVTEKFLADWDAYIQVDGPGDKQLRIIRQEAEESGCVGVPHIHFEIGEEKKGLFGREHLSLVRLKLHQHGLAMNESINPHISHAWIR
eukprot:g35.t1